MALTREEAERLMNESWDSREEKSKQTWFGKKKDYSRNEPAKEVVIPKGVTSMAWMEANFEVLQKTFIRHHLISPYDKSKLINDYKSNVRFVRLSAPDEVWESIEKRFRAYYGTISRNIKKC